MDRYRDLIVFSRCVAEGSFSAAARSLSLTPSAISKLVTRLENRLGVRLFDRSGREVALTSEGEVFHRAALRAIASVEEAEVSVAKGSLPGETLRIRSMPTFAASQLSQLLPAFRRQHPQMRIEVHLRMEPGNLLEGGMDVAIQVGHMADSSLVATAFAHTRWIICASPGYLAAHGAPRTPAELKHHECLNFLPGMSASNWAARAARDYPLKVTSNLITNQGQMLQELARADFGIVRLTEYQVAQDLLGGQLVELFPRHQAVEQDPIYAIYHKHRHLSARLRVFLDFLKQAYADRPPGLQRWRHIGTQ